MKKIQKAALVLSALLVSVAASAETKKIIVKGMHCESCADTVRAALCGNQAFKRCEVKIKSEKKQLGEVTIETKEGKVDMDAVKAIIEKEGFKL